MSCHLASLPVAWKDGTGPDNRSRPPQILGSRRSQGVLGTALTGHPLYYLADEGPLSQPLACGGYDFRREIFGGAIQAQRLHVSMQPMHSPNAWPSPTLAP